MPRSMKQILRQFYLAGIWRVIATLTVAMFWLPAAAQQEAPKAAAAQIAESPKAKAFPSPEAAAAAIYAAARRNDEAEILAILGPGAKEAIGWADDPKEREARHQQFAQRYDQMHRLVTEPDGTVALYVGAENWPAPIPIVEYQGAWYFDAELGRQEILYRRIGRNEMEAIQVCRALGDAEKDYFAAVHRYTDKFVSSKGKHDGLYWQTTEEMGKSPIGPYLAHAGVEGSQAGSRQPYHGYYYRILLLAGSASPGSDFALFAFPAEYRSSGVMSFLVNQSGEAYQKDLGSASASAASDKIPYPPDTSWKKVE